MPRGPPASRRVWHDRDVLPYLAQPKRSKLRASDLDRHHTVELLRQHAGEGRITTEELEERIEVAFHSKTLGELATLTSDLPVDPTAMPSASAAIAGFAGFGHDKTRRKLLRRLRLAVTLDLVAVVIWAASGGGRFWPAWVFVLSAIPLLLTASRWVERRLSTASRRPAPKPRY